MKNKLKSVLRWWARALVAAASMAGIMTGCAPHGGDGRQDHTVSSVDLSRYMGKWYEIASFPAWFQKDCHCTTAEYTLMGDHVAVENSCRKGGPSGETETAKAKAYTVPGTDNAQLKVQFMWPFKGDYWIIALDEDYRHAMVGHPKKKYLWILSRTPRMDEDVYLSLVETARRKGYDTDRLRKTDQSCFAES